MTGRIPAGLTRAGRQVAAAGPQRLAVTGLFLALALALARYGWAIPGVADAERALYDLRMVLTAPAAEQDERIVMVVYNDQTLIDTRKRSPLDRAILADALAQIDRMGARSIGIDILIDQPQDEDDRLTAALRAMRTPTFLAYAEVTRNADNIIFEQQKFLDGFMAGLKGSQTRPASIRLTTDSDGVARRWAASPPGLPPLLSRAMVRADPAFDGPVRPDYRGGIAYRRAAEDDRPLFASLPIDLFRNPDLAAALAPQIQGRHVLIGGDIVDIDQFETPFTAFTNGTMIGLAVHAQMLAQILDGRWFDGFAPPAYWSMALLVVIAGGLTSLIEWRFRKMAPLLLAELVAIVGMPFAFQSMGRDTVDLPAVGWLIGWGLAYAAVGSAARALGAEQRRFAQSALGKYLPRDIAREIIERPEKLALHGEKRNIFVLFSDLEGFTKLSHALPPETVARLLNRYLEMLSTVVLDHGGVIDKFVGDAVVAFWGAPIAREDDGRKAALAGYALWQAGEAFRRSVGPDIPPIGKTRVGLHYGEAIVGNFGGEGRIQYTALGDSMNTAARLEAANKPLGSSVMASREFVERSDLDWWRPMGRVVLRGRATPVEIFEPAPDFPTPDREELTRLIALADSDIGAAVTALTALSARYPDDKALTNLVSRLQETRSGDAYILS